MNFSKAIALMAFVNLASFNIAAQGTGEAKIPSITLYSEANYFGVHQTIKSDQQRLGYLNFNDRAQSIKVAQGVWLVCEHSEFSGRCDYIDSDVPELRSIRLRKNISSIKLSSFSSKPQKGAITLYENSNYEGGYFGIDRDMSDLSAIPIIKKFESILVRSDEWIICSEINFEGACEYLDASIGKISGSSISDRVLSVRRATNEDKIEYRKLHLRDERISHDLECLQAPDSINCYTQPIDHSSRASLPQTDNEVEFLEGNNTVYYPQPKTRTGLRIAKGFLADDNFCESEQHQKALYSFDDGKYLSDVLCLKR